MKPRNNPFRRSNALILAGSIAALGLAFGTSRAGAQTIGFSANAFTGDANSGISTGNTYTVTANIIGSNVAINGVTFTGSGNTTSGTNWSLTGNPALFTSGGIQQLSGSAVSGLFDGFQYAGNPGVMTLSGLTVGKAYTTTFYNQAWEFPGTRQSNVTAGTDSISYNQDMAPGSLLSYTFVASATTQAINFTPVVPGTTFHFYGFSNQDQLSNTLTLAAGGNLSLNHSSTTTNPLFLSGAGTQTIVVPNGQNPTLTGGVSTDGSSGTLMIDGASLASASHNLTFSGGTMALGAKSFLVQGNAGNNPPISQTTTLSNVTLTTSGNVGVGRANLVIGGTSNVSVGGVIGGSPISPSADWGFLTIQDSAVVTATGGVNGNAEAWGLRLNGGTLNTPSIQASNREGDSNGALLRFNGTRVVATASNASFVTVGANGGGTNSAFVDGGGAIFDSSGFNIGIAVNLKNGGAADGGLQKLGAGTLTLSGVNTYTGTTTVSAGTLVLSGARTVTSGHITVGNVNGSTGTLNVSNGTFSTGTVVLGSGNGTALGIINQTGGTLTLTGTQLIMGNGGAGGAAVGTGGNGTYNLSAGSLITSTSANRGIMMGTNDGGTSTFNLSGTGILNASNAVLMVGRSDANTPNTTNLFNQTGGTATVGTLTIGGAAAVATGFNSTFTATGGTFSATNFTALGAGDSGVVTMNIGGTAVVTLPAFPTTRGAGTTATINFDGGTLKNAAASATYMGGLTNAFIKAGGANFDTTNGGITITQNLLTHGTSTGGGLTKVGANTLTLSGANSYTGATSVSGGALTLSGTNASSTYNVTAGTLSLSIASGATTSGQIATGATVNISNGAALNINFGGTQNLTTAAVLNNFALNLNGGTSLTVTGDNLDTITLPGAITLTGANTVSFSQIRDTLVLGGAMGGAGGITFLGGGLQDSHFVKLTAQSNYGGATGITSTAGGMTLLLSTGADRLPTGTTLTITASSTNIAQLNLGGQNQTLAGLVAAGTLTKAQVVNTGGGTPTLTINNSGAGTYAGILGGTGPADAVNNTLVSGDSFALTKTGNGTQTLSGPNTYTGTTTVSGGRLVYQNTYASTSHAIATGATLEINVASGTRDSATTTFSGVGTFVKSGAGQLVWGSGAATFALGAGSLIDVQGGTFIGGNNANEVWTNNLSTLNVAGGAIFDGVESNVRVDALTGAGTIQSGYNGAGYVNFTFGVNNGSGTFSGVLANSTNPGSFVKTGSGTQTLSGTNTYTGGSTITGGTLALGHATDTLAGAVTLNGGTLAIGTNSDSVGAVTLTSGSITGSTGVLTGSSYATTNGTISAILGGTGALTQSGAGTTTLSGANTYTGSTTINTGGALALSSTGSIANSSVITANGTLNVSAQSGVTIGAAQTLKGSGTVNVGSGGNLAIAGTLAAGNSPGVLSVSNGSGGTGSTSFSAGSIFAWELDTTLSGRGVGYDGVNTSAVTGSGGIFQVVLQGTQGFSDTFWSSARTWSNIFTTNGTTPVTSDLAAVFSSFSYANSSGVLANPSTIGSFTLTGSALSWSLVPEPTSALAGLLLGAGLLRRRRSSVTAAR